MEYFPFIMIGLVIAAIISVVCAAFSKSKIATSREVLTEPQQKILDLIESKINAGEVLIKKNYFSEGSVWLPPTHQFSMSFHIDNGLYIEAFKSLTSEVKISIVKNQGLPVYPEELRSTQLSELLCKYGRLQLQKAADNLKQTQLEYKNDLINQALRRK